MSKPTSKASRTKRTTRTTAPATPQTAVAKLIARYKLLDKIGADLDEARDYDSPCSHATTEEMLKLEPLITLTEVECVDDIAAKWRFVIDCDLIDDGPSTLNRLLETIFQRDVDRIGASIPELEAEMGITVKSVGAGMTNATVTAAVEQVAAR